ncbi:GntR family transcriptional regulator [Okibacterium endophyticum]
MTIERQAKLRSLGGIDRKNLRELSLARLREAISSGELPPGTHLAEIELSEALSISRGTLREALRHLQQEGLLSTDARGRLSVRVVSKSEVYDIFAVRSALEALAFEQICQSDERQRIVDELRAKLEPLRSEGGTLNDRLEADLEFHATMCRLSGNETLYKSWIGVSGLARAAMTAAGPDRALTNMAHSRHAPIVDLLEQGDAEAGRLFLKNHMREAADRIIADLPEAG